MFCDRKLLFLSLGLAVSACGANGLHAQAPAQVGVMSVTERESAALVLPETLPGGSSSAELFALPENPLPVGTSKSGVSLGAGSLGGQAGIGAGTSRTAVAPKYATVILAGQSAQPLTAGGKVAFAARESVSPFTFLSVLVSATYSQAVDSAPHYGQGWGPYGQRIGAAAARNTVQLLATDAVFAPILRDDPRYYALGRDHKLTNRAIYAASRVVLTRSDSGARRINVPLLAGYAVAAGANNLFYPERDRSGSQTAENWGSSLGGAVLGFEVNEFLDDALRIVHFRK